MNIGFISTRFHGTDGVSLEAAKWVSVLEDDLGHTAFWFAGKLDTPPDRSRLVEKASFEHPEALLLQRVLFGLSTRRPPEISALVDRFTAELKNEIRTFIRQHHIDVLIPQNILAIPMHVPLGLAVAEVIEEDNIPTIAHHHDFAWERERFTDTIGQDYLERAFPPPRTTNFKHVVINSQAGTDLQKHRSVPSTVVPNVFDFENTPPAPDGYADDFRQQFGIADDEIIILQPTRIIPRKGIEYAIDLVQRLAHSPAGQTQLKPCLVVSHGAGDEGFEYLDMLKRHAGQLGVRVLWIGDRVGDSRAKDPAGRKIYRLWDIYPKANFVTYPSIYEGFGNAFLEAIYFRKPLLVNRYPVYSRDIEPIGFKVVAIDGVITHEAVQQTRFLIENPEVTSTWTELNHRLARQHFSYQILRDKLAGLLH
ncbi:MAG: glycosyltransferase family 4 protein [Verrucomicrobiales bacterium]|nr:glycosyltransferase family 4 protein [Verrucomicrobiales bacterium]